MEVLEKDKRSDLFRRYYASVATHVQADGSWPTLDLLNCNSKVVNIRFSFGGNTS